MTRRIAFWRNQGGASAVEFALVVPAFIALTLGAINLSLAMFFNAALHQAVDDTARYVSVCSTSCVTAQARFSADFNFPSLSPSLSPAATCTISGSQLGNLKVATATYRLNAIVVSIPITMRAQSCFPVQD